MPFTKHAYSSCCGGNLSVIDMSCRSSYRPLYECDQCGNATATPVIDDRPFLAGDVVRFKFLAKGDADLTVQCCRRSHSYVWDMVATDGSVVGCGLLELEQANENMRR